MEYFHAEAIVAAILATKVTHDSGTSPENMMTAYREMLRQIRQSGHGLAQGDIQHKS